MSLPKAVEVVPASEIPKSEPVVNVKKLDTLAQAAPVPSTPSASPASPSEGGTAAAATPADLKKAEEKLSSLLGPKK